MPHPERIPKLGDIVLFHQSIRQDIWEQPKLVTLPAIVTEVLAPNPETGAARLRLTAFRPFDKPLWDIEAHHAETPEPGSWSWREGPGA